MIVICSSCYSKGNLPKEPVEIGRPGCEDCSICGSKKAGRPGCGSKKAGPHKRLRKLDK